MRSDTEKKLVLSRNMCRSYWERWRWELEKRKESMARELRLISRQKARVAVDAMKANEISPDLLVDPIDSGGTEIESYIGRGAFGVVKLQTYRGIKVAVKELLPRTVAADVRNEAMLLCRLCHPYLPLLFGVVTSSLPHRLVLQYHGLASNCMSTTLYGILQDSSANEQYKSERLLVMLCLQLLEALRYLHDEANVLHNDLKCDNVVVCDSLCEPLSSASSSSQDSHCVQIVIIDFGKGTTIENARRYKLNFLEQSEYLRKYPYIAPEVIEGATPQSRMSDMFSAGGIIQRVSDNHAMLTSEVKRKMSHLATKCRSACYFNRPTAKEALSILQEIITSLD